MTVVRKRILRFSKNTKKIVDYKIKDLQNEILATDYRIKMI